MLCQVCKLNSATFHSVEIIDGRQGEHHLCRDCWQKSRAAFRASMEIHDPIAMYAGQMEIQPKLTKKSFAEVLASRETDPSQFAKKLCAISIRFLFEEVDASYPANLISLKLDRIQKCHEQLMIHAHCFSNESYLKWRKILKGIVRDTGKM